MGVDDGATVRIDAAPEAEAVLKEDDVAGCRASGQAHAGAGSCAAGA